MKENHPSYYDVGCREVSKENRKVTEYYYYNYYKLDLKYRGLNVKYIIMFLVKNKMKANGKQKKYNGIRKYKDAILWGSSVLNEPLPVSFHQEMEEYLAGYKREVVKVKKEGNTDKTASDQISFELYRLFLRWSVEESNILM